MRISGISTFSTNGTYHTFLVESALLLFIYVEGSILFRRVEKLSHLSWDFHWRHVYDFPNRGLH
jgi:hypothetical protein